MTIVSICVGRLGPNWRGMLEKRLRPEA